MIKLSVEDNEVITHCVGELLVELAFFAKKASIKGGNARKLESPMFVELEGQWRKERIEIIIQFKR